MHSAVCTLTLAEFVVPEAGADYLSSVNFQDMVLLTHCERTVTSSRTVCTLLYECYC